MKKSTLFLVGAIFLSVICRGQDIRPVLQRTLNAFEATNVYAEKVNIGNQMALIAAKWNNEWIAHYYVAYCKAILSSLEKEDAKRDAWLDEADKEHDAAVNLLGKENDETYVLGAVIAYWRIDISPMSRSGQYGKIFREDMAKAKELNPANPRIYYLQGMAKYAMPSFVGGGKEVAKPLFQKADSLFEKETDADISKPYWGKAKNAFYLGECKK